MVSDAKIAEKEHQAKVVDTLRLFGYEVQHVYKLRTIDGSWQTGTTESGWPDLTAIREPRILGIEIKAATGRLTDEQRAWLTMFASVPCARAWVLRPTDDWSLTLDWIKNPKDAPAIFGFTPVDDPSLVLAAARARRSAARRR